MNRRVFKHRDSGCPIAIYRPIEASVAVPENCRPYGVDVLIFPAGSTAHFTNSSPGRHAPCAITRMSTHPTPEQ